MTRDELIGKVAERLNDGALGCPHLAFSGVSEPSQEECNKTACYDCWATAIVNLVESCREEAKP
jgi:hypothetical protein